MQVMHLRTRSCQAHLGCPLPAWHGKLLRSAREGAPLKACKLQLPTGSSRRPASTRKHGLGSSLRQMSPTACCRRAIDGALGLLFCAWARIRICCAEMLATHQASQKPHHFSCENDEILFFAGRPRRVTGSRSAPRVGGGTTTCKTSSNPPTRTNRVGV